MPGSQEPHFVSSRSSTCQLSSSSNCVQQYKSSQKALSLRLQGLKHRGLSSFGVYVRFGAVRLRVRYVRVWGFWGVQMWGLGWFGESGGGGGETDSKITSKSQAQRLRKHFLTPGDYEGFLRTERTSAVWALLSQHR